MTASKFNPALLASIAAGASLGTNAPDVNDTNVGDIPIALIDPNPYQPRLDYDPIEVRALADSIKEYGLLQYIVVRRDGDRYTIIAGHTRLEAFKLLGRYTIPANIIDVSDTEMAALALIENVQRAQLHPLEICIAISRPPFDEMKDEEIAQILGYSNVTKVRNIRSISRLSEEVREHMSANRPKIGVDLLVELQKYPEQYQMGEYKRILSGDANRASLRETLQALNQAQSMIKARETAQKPIQPFKVDHEGYHIECGKLPKKSRESFEKDLFDLMVRHGIRPSTTPP